MIVCLRLTALVLIASLVATSASADDRPSNPKVHPLQRAAQYAKSHRDYIHKHVRDYTCQLIKRETIDGELQRYRKADVKVRCGNGSENPTCVLMKFSSPSTMKGRTVLFVEGRNDDLVLVRKGGAGILKTVELEIDPHGRAAKRESNHPITEVGFDKLMDRLIELINEDIQRDPDSSNTKIEYFRNAKFKDRSCTRIQLVHPENTGEFPFHQASLFMDDELHVPVRLVVYGWEKDKKGKPELLEEYNYVDLQLNVGLREDLFEKSRYFKLDD